MLGLGLLLTNIRNRISFFSKFDFIAAYRASDDTQNIGAAGTTLNIMPKGTVAATSVHNTDILVKDNNNVFQVYPVDAPLWEGGRVSLVGAPGTDVDETYSTDINGTSLSPHPWQVSNDATTNLLFPSEPPVNTTVTLAANEYTLWIEGTGSITSTYGTATEASPLTFTGNTLAELFTVVGSVDIAQIALGSSKAAYARSTTAAASIPATPYTYPAANIDPSDAHIGMTFDAGLVDKTLIDIGGVVLLSYGDVGDGVELVTDPEFDDPSAWIIGGGVIADSFVTFSGSSDAYVTQNITYPVGVKLAVIIDCTQFDATTTAITRFANGGTSTTYQRNWTGVGRHLITLTPGLDTTGLRAQLLGIQGDEGIVKVNRFSVQVATKGLILSDGTNYSTVPLSAGSHTVEIKLIGSTMQLIVDGVAEAAVTYVPIAAGLITNTTPKFYQFTAKAAVAIAVIGLDFSQAANSAYIGII